MKNLWPYWASDWKAYMLSQFDKNQGSYWIWSPEAKFNIHMGNRTTCEYNGGSSSHTNVCPVNPRAKIRQGEANAQDLLVLFDSVVCGTQASRNEVAFHLDSSEWAHESQWNQNIWKENELFSFIIFTNS